ncbi:MAG: sensor signal transduction histidine kinase [Solirubrobacterales bacterium]|nr:sensor signal transduction histidine kinase [Solirubrobacterales bacterium]
MRLPIRLRLTAWYVLLLAVVLVGVGAFASARLHSTLGHEIDQSLASAAPKLTQGYAAEGAQDFFDVANTVFPAMPAGPSAAEVVDPSGRLLVAYGAPRLRRRILEPALVAAAARGHRIRTTVSLSGEPFRVLAVPVLRHGHTDVVVLAKSLHNRDAAISKLVVLLLIALPVALALAALGGWLLARRALRPVEQLTSRADAIRADDFAERIAVPRTRDEIAHLAETLNAMLERLQRGVDERRRLVADASHELRTPLAAMRAELDVTLLYDELSPAARRVLESSREEVERMTALVGNLLTLASIDEGQLHLRREEADVGALLEAVAALLARLAADAGVELAVEVAGEPVHVVGDRERIREVAVNLATNAIKFAGRGARIRLATSADGFLVADDGPGIAPDAQARVFDRFWRAEDSRTREHGGSGLGLAICREIVDAHGGRIDLESKPGRGACFRVTLPKPRLRAPAALKTPSPV